MQFLNQTKTSVANGQGMLTRQLLLNNIVNGFDICLPKLEKMKHKTVTYEAQYSGLISLVIKCVLNHVVYSVNKSIASVSVS